VQLSCKSCGSLLESDERDVVFLCPSCGQGYSLARGELEEVEILFASSRLGAPGKRVEYLPFWVMEGEVHVQSREALGGFFRSLRDERSGRISATFYVPCFEAPLSTLKALGETLTREAPDFESSTGRGRTMRGCVHSEDFAKGFADFIFLSLEAEKSDKMRSIDYRIEFGKSKIVAIPFAHEKGNKMKDLLTGSKISAWEVEKG